MAFNTDDLKRVLVSKKIVSTKTWDEFAVEAKAKKQDIAEYLVDKKIIDEEKLAQISSGFLDVEYVDLKNGGQIAKDVLMLVPEPIARRHGVIAFGKERDKLKLAMTDPEDLATRDALRKKTDLIIVPFLISKSSLEWGLKQYHTSLEAEFAKIVSQPSKEGEQEKEEVTEKLKEMAS